MWDVCHVDSNPISACRFQMLRSLNVPREEYDITVQILQGVESPSVSAGKEKGNEEEREANWKPTQACSSPFLHLAVNI